MRRILTLALILSPTAALAHPGHGAGFAAGFDHPFSGADHMLAMVAVGLWAAAVGGRALWAMPLAFLSALLAGGAMGHAGYALPATEPMILASILLLGLAAALLTRPPLLPALAMVAVFGLAHGNAHGLEAPPTGFAGFAAGFFLATALLHGIGLVAGRNLAMAGRGAGLAIAAAGAFFAFS